MRGEESAPRRRRPRRRPEHVLATVSSATA
jgi:hypothetical protein